jgi:hypothetical protein
MPRHNLGELEQFLVLAILQLGGEGYGASIRAVILERAGRSITPGAIYPTLDRLEARGVLRSRVGDPTERGGRVAATSASRRPGSRRSADRGAERRRCRPDALKGGGDA